MRQTRWARGFVLAMTLWILAAITVVAIALSSWALSELRAAQAERDSVQDRIDMLGTRDTLLYLMGTRKLNVGGVPGGRVDRVQEAVRALDELDVLSMEPSGAEVRMDARPYQGLGDSRFSIQDESGLFSLLVANPAWLDRFLKAKAVPPESIPRLRETLFDWQDPDDLVRLNGAEKREYERKGMLPPPNRRLLMPGEVRNILGWSTLAPDVMQSIVDESTVHYSGAVNLNAVPPGLLPAWLTGCPTTCKTFLDLRRRQPFRSAAQVETLLGVRLPGDADLDYRFGPDDASRITVWGRLGGGWRYHVRLTPLADKRGPWTILAAYPTQRPPDDALAEPTHSYLFPDPAPARH